MSYLGQCQKTSVRSLQSYLGVHVRERTGCLVVLPTAQGNKNRPFVIAPVPGSHKALAIKAQTKQWVQSSPWPQLEKQRHNLPPVTQLQLAARHLQFPNTSSAQELLSHEPHRGKKSWSPPSRWKWLVLKKMWPLVWSALTPAYCCDVPVNAADRLTPVCKLKLTLWLTLWKSLSQSRRQSTYICMKSNLVKIHVFISQDTPYMRQKYPILVWFLFSF